jgi:hypothetical protein
MKHHPTPHHPAPEQPDITRRLPRHIYYQVIHTLRATLAPVSDTPEDLARRDNAAIAQVAALLPANADEANLAALYVAAGAYAMDCLRLARERAPDHVWVLKCGAQAASTMRQARATRSLLLRVQAERQKRQADQAAVDTAARTEHCAIELMAEALGTEAVGTEAGGAQPAAMPAAMAEPPAPNPVLTAAKPAGIVADAERYALSHRKRAALIRTLGHLPDKLDFGPLSPQLVAAIVTGNSPVLRSLDTGARQPRA